MRTLPLVLRTVAPALLAALVLLPLASTGPGFAAEVPSPGLSAEAFSPGPSAEAAPSAEATPSSVSEPLVPQVDEGEDAAAPTGHPPSGQKPTDSPVHTPVPVPTSPSPTSVPELSGGLSVSTTSVPPAATTAINQTAKTYASALGKHTGSINCGLKNSGCYRSFEKGSVHWTASTGAQPTFGGIRNRWRAMGWENSKLGYPVEPERSIGTGFVQRFQGGAIHWSSATGAHSTWRAIQRSWANHGWEKGRLGYPTAEERSVKGGTAQAFQGGDIHWSSATGAHPTFGGIRTAWKKSGSETGVLGFPRYSEACGLVKNGCFQKFAGGEMYWSSASGAHPVTGEILALWTTHNKEKGAYGYPTGSASITTAGRLTQKFQGGTLTTGIIRKGLPHGVVPDGGRQLVIAHSASRTSTRGDLELWSLRDEGVWKRDHLFTQARFGYNGLAATSGKREGDGKTPMGQYRIPFSFGKNTKPAGTTIEYRKVDSNDQWCTRSGSTHYNRWMGAPNANCTAKQAEVLSKYAQYNYAAVVDYNSAQQANRGSAIFVHSHGTGSTAGCVSVTTAQMQTLTRWLDPKKTPRIVIAPRGELKNM